MYLSNLIISFIDYNYVRHYIMNWEKKCLKLTCKLVTSRECQMKRKTNCDDKVILKALVQAAWKGKAKRENLILLLLF